MSINTYINLTNANYYDSIVHIISKFNKFIEYE